MTTKPEKKPPLPARELDRYHARPSTTELGQWTILEQLKGETFARLFTRARDVIAAARILEALRATFAVEVVRINPSGVVLLATGDEVAVYADGSVFRKIDENGVPSERVPKKEHATLADDAGDSLVVNVVRIQAAVRAAAELGGWLVSSDRIVTPELVRRLITALAGATELLRCDPSYRNGPTHSAAVAALEAADQGGAWLGGAPAERIIYDLRTAVSDLLRTAGTGYTPSGETISRARAALEAAGGAP